MATTDTGQGIAQETVDLWVKSYQGEVFGEAYFSHVAALSTDPVERHKLDALATLERCTKDLLAPCMDRLGIPTEPDRSMIEAVTSATDFDYRTMLETVAPIAAEYLGYYARLRQLVEPQDAGVADQLIAHEMALELFARRELAGETERSLEPIRALAHVSL